MIFKARKICPQITLSHEEAARIGRELIKLNGDKHDFRSLATQDIVKAARDKSSSMHKIIWGKSDSELAWKARCDLALKLKGSIQIVLRDDEGSFRAPLSVVVSLAEKQPIGHVRTDWTVESPFAVHQMEEKAISGLNEWLDRYRAFKHGPRLGPLWNRVRAALEDQDALDDEESRARRFKNGRSRSENRPRK